MPILEDFAEALTGGQIDVVDLTAPLSDRTPIIQLPPPFAQTATFQLEEISRFDERGPAWYWNNLRTGEHTGTHFEAPAHWVAGRDGEDVATVPARKLVGPVAVLDLSEQVAADHDFLLEVDHVREWEKTHGPLPAGGWLLYRTGWDARSYSQAAVLHADASGPPTPGVSPAGARWLGEEVPVIGFGVETGGTAAGAARSFDPPFPCHAA